ncbi:unnamed protein product [Periconia digitata]|uniref:Uncharacterized protein n=1 Tax=Periconia digitata TaxID=1303443 RepID=A0A9W4U7A1_9PLEO|nr:unnamed protein product [Periconia digitata]
MSQLFNILMVSSRNTQDLVYHVRPPCDAKPQTRLHKSIDLPYSHPLIACAAANPPFLSQLKITPGLF